MLPLLLAALETEEDKARFLQFYERHKTGLFRDALALLPDRALAEEAAQEAWAKCAQHADTFFALDPPGRLPWLRVVLRHTAWDIRRKEARHQPLPEDWDAPAPAEGRVDGIMAVIRAMPETYRQVLELKFVLEWTDRAIARHLGLSVTAVSTRVSRGRKLLQERLIEEGYEP